MQPTYLIAAALTLVGLAVGGIGGAWYQSARDATALDTQLAAKDRQIEALRRALTESEKRRTREALIRTIEGQGTPVPVSEPHPLPAPSVFSTLTIPEKNTRFCRDATLTITWKADTARVDQVRINLNSPMVPTGPLADVPVTWNETGERGMGNVAWRVGKAHVAADNFYDLPDGETYRLRVDALYKGALVETKTSALFAIQTCEG